MSLKFTKEYKRKYMRRYMKVYLKNKPKFAEQRRIIAKKWYHDKLKDLKKFIKKKSKQTCFKSLAYCCKRRCPYRNQTIQELGLTKKEFYKLKKQFDKNLISLLWQKRNFIIKKLKGGGK